MSALAVDELAAVTGRLRAELVLVEDHCRDCNRVLAAFEEFRCADCADLALHAECRDCGAVLRDADLAAGVCTDCIA
ncbi:hypothetical protein SPF06_20180 [Sinomonas sp. JGH33]|uniref:Uncharacterized protein n=1 Tax=Sinomonas terricola TaxID=3110330 RepID=A0ABU5TC34_9MICC|nr:hypothetical protein [Sinomonas sp. JGH33]MEA5457049.1 hypothetical protein [Sinomonas sp. JGH33]